MFFFLFWLSIVLLGLSLICLILSAKRWLTKSRHLRFIEASERECYLKPWHYERIEHAVKSDYYKVLYNEQGTLVGYILYRVNEHLSYTYHPKSGDKLLVLISDFHILRMGILRRYRNQGYGKKIFFGFVEDLEKRKCSNILCRLFLHIRKQDYDYKAREFINSLQVIDSDEKMLKKNYQTSTLTHESFGWAT